MWILRGWNRSLSVLLDWVCEVQNMELAADGSRAWTKIRTLACLFPLPLLLCLPLTLLHCCVSHWLMLYIAEEILSHYLSPSEPMGNCLWCSASGKRLMTAARDGDVEEARMLLEMRPGLAKYSTFGGLSSPLHVAASGGHSEVLFLIQATKFAWNIACLQHYFRQKSESQTKYSFNLKTRKIYIRSENLLLFQQEVAVCWFCAQIESL